MEKTQQEKRKIIDYFVIVLALFLPITSFVLFPTVQGTTVGYVMSILSVFFLLFKKEFKYLVGLFFLIFSYILISFLADSTHIIIQFNDILTNKNNIYYSIFGQTIYLIPGIILMFFIMTNYRDKWLKYFLLGASLLAIYGIYEVIFYFLFGYNGDFISNRFFDDGFNASSFQLIQIGNVTMLRLKSLTGEPSMYAFTIIPFWIVANEKGYKKTSILLMVSLVLSTSTTAIMGIIIYYSMVFIRSLLNPRRIKMKTVNVIMLCIIAFAILSLTGVLNPVYNWVRLNILDKLLGASTSESGVIRTNEINQGFNLLSRVNIIHQLFGIGFGMIRTANMYTNLLVNIGIVGLSAIMFLYIYLMYRITVKKERWIFCILVIYLFMFIAVSEFAYLPLWLFLGIALNKIKRTNNLETRDHAIEL